MWRIKAQATSFYDLIKRGRIVSPKRPPTMEMIDLPDVPVVLGITTSVSDSALPRLSVGCGEPTLP